MNPKEIFIKNWHKLVKWWKKYASTLIASFALIVSLYSICLSTQDFIATHRPYVYVTSRTSDKGSMDVKSVMLHCLNAPAKIVGQEFCYVVVEMKENGEEKDINTIPWTSLPISQTLYPSGKISRQVYFPYDFQKEILDKDPKVKLRRKVRINYKELSSDRTYFFEGNWDYNRDYDLWEDKNMFGN